MKKMIMLAAVAACLNASAGVGATTNWVARYVADYVANAISNSPSEMASAAVVTTSNGVTRISAGIGDYVLVASFENASILALTATNCTAEAVAAGISNGERWAAMDGGGFRGVGVPDITPTPTNYVCGSFGSAGNLPIEFSSPSGAVFRTTARYVTPSVAKEIRGDE